MSADGFGDIAALAGGGFLLSMSSGLLEVSAQGMAVPLMSSPVATSYPPDGRELYVAGRPLASALLGGDDVAVDTDGTIVLDTPLLGLDWQSRAADSKARAARRVSGRPLLPGDCERGGRDADLACS